MELTEREAKIFEAVKQGVSGTKAITIATGLMIDQCSKILKRLCETGALRKIKKSLYEPMIEEYTLVERHVGDIIINAAIVINTNVSQDIKDYIVGHRNLVKRTELAKRLGIGKLELNQIIIQMDMAELAERRLTWGG